MGKKVLITAGGTGGHIYPAEALAEQLRAKGCDILFVGGKLSQNRYFHQNQYPYREVSSGPLSLKNPLTATFHVGSISKGSWQSYRLFKEFRPDIIVGFGSYYTFPTLLAAVLCKIPFVLHEANSIPGKVNRLLSRYAAVTGVHFSETAPLLSGPTAVVGMPLRETFRCVPCRRAEAARYFGLDFMRTTLLIFGGSQGANAINRLFPIAVAHAGIQVIHVTGDLESAESLSREYRQSGIRAAVKGYEERMDLAWHMADCVVSRAGAGTIAEQLEFEIPGILVPFPGAADRHQDKNAEIMVKAGGAIKISQEELSVSSFQEQIDLLLAQSGAMQDAMRHYKHQTKAGDLCSLVLDEIKKKPEIKAQEFA